MAIRSAEKWNRRWTPGEPADSSTFSAAALDEYNAAMAGIDALLARRGVSLDEDDADNAP